MHADKLEGITSMPNLKCLFLEKIQELRNNLCWGFIAGEGTGSVVILDFGKKIRREKQLDNPALTKEQQKYEGEMDLFVECTWRLETEDRVICSSTDPNENNGPMLMGLKKLVGKKVKNILVSVPSFDLKISFEKNLYFLLFCDQTNVTEQCDNYSFSLDDKIFIISTKSELRLESR